MSENMSFEDVRHCARFMVGNPSAWDEYDDGASEIIRSLLASHEEAEGRERASEDHRNNLADKIVSQATEIGALKAIREEAAEQIASLTARAEKAEQQVAERARVLRAVQCQAENAAYNLGQPESGWCTKDATRAFHNISGTIEAALSSDSQEATHVGR